MFEYQMFVIVVIEKEKSKDEKKTKEKLQLSVHVLMCQIILLMASYEPFYSFFQTTL